MEARPLGAAGLLDRLRGPTTRRTAGSRCARGVRLQLPDDFFPPLRPAAAFCAFVPPWLDALRRLPEPDDLPPRLEEPSELAMRAARSLLIPFLRKPSYCVSFLMLDPWSLAMS